ncbi:DUF4432 family protein [Rhizobium mongolense]|uniref:DUF4432 family protein n=2 Tax=Rhizobium mongolense TaxID=57676 RepID=A0ABR6IJE1_9HYPH|nr:DUF4432 family protein [Rhizobium mongolense]MBB4227992.1 hypothetical protein [Rhizobium mongolense]TVZ64856.1 uncharacterized protein DUF4432 [Rhizobium mongolense USDA 1844]
MRIHLQRAQFQDTETILATSDGFTVSAFRYHTGVEALRVKTSRIDAVILPYVGQQIWSATIDGHEIGMKSMVRLPKRGVPLLENLGGLFFHCGLTAIAAPGEGDDHPLHGELPSAEFDEAWIDVDQDAGGLSVGGSFEYAKAFTAHYAFRPSVHFAAAEPWFDIRVEVQNLKRTSMDVCYLGHINFRPVDGSRLEYSAPYTNEAVVVRSSVPAHLKPSARYLELLSDLARHPEAHHTIADTQEYDPEMVFKVGYLHDEDGWAHGLQVHGDGSSDWVAHRPAEFPHAFRWISRTGDQDALAITEPATCGLSGYKNEKAIGSVPSLDGQSSWRASMRVGRLPPERSHALLTKIAHIADR